MARFAMGDSPLVVRYDLEIDYETGYHRSSIVPCMPRRVCRPGLFPRVFSTPLIVSWTSLVPIGTDHALAEEYDTLVHVVVFVPIISCPPIVDIP